MASPTLYYCQTLSDLQPISCILPLFATISPELYTHKTIFFVGFHFSPPYILHIFICNSVILAICFDEKLITRGDDRVILSLAPVPGEDI